MESEWVGFSPMSGRLVGPASSDEAPLASGPCDVSFSGRIVAGGLPLANAPLELHDKLHVTSADDVDILRSASANRWVPSSKIVSSGRTDGDGGFTFCVSRAALPDGTLDAFVRLRTVDPVVASVMASGRSVAVHTDSGALAYEADSAEFRDVADGDFDAGTLVPREPGPYPPVVDDLPDCPIEFASGPTGRVVTAERPQDDLVCLPRSILPYGSVASAFAVYSYIHYAAHYLASDLGVGMGHVEVYYPDESCFGGAAACYYGGQAEIVVPAKAAGYSIVVHEYGHHVMYTRSTSNVVGGWHACGTASGAMLAWSEGFADFMPAFASRFERSTLCRGDEAPPSAFGAEDEANVAATLEDLLDDANEPGDPATVSAADFWRVFTRGPHTYQTFHDLWLAEFGEGSREAVALAAVEAHNGIAS